MVQALWPLSQAILFCSPTSNNEGHVLFNAFYPSCLPCLGGHSLCCSAAFTQDIASGSTGDVVLHLSSWRSCYVLFRESGNSHWFFPLFQYNFVHPKCYGYCIFPEQVAELVARVFGVVVHL